MASLSDHSVSGPRLGFSALATLLLLAVLASPIVAVFSFIGADTQGLWAHLANTVLATYVVNTALLVAGVVAIAAVTGAGTAWLVSMYAFPGRKLFEFALVLPLAMPAYILAYAYTDLLQVTGPVQNALREATGWGVRDYWFPEIRSLGGAVFVLAAALYPYVYLVTRASFLEQSGGAVDVARTLGLTRAGAFWRVALPMTRPALVAGTTLVAMETLADFGAVKYFDQETFTTGIYRAWFAYGNPAAAAQLASILLVAVFAVVTFEQASRGARRYAVASGTRREIIAWQLTGWRGAAAAFACFVPVAAGFLLPAGALVLMALDTGHELTIARLGELAANTGLLAAVAAVLAVVLAGAISFSAGRGESLSRQASRLTYLGYATPGVVVGVGLLIVAGAADSVLRDATSAGKLVISGSFAVLIYAYLVRFFAVAHGPVDAAFVKLGPRYGEAARVLGLRPGAAFRHVELPLMRGTLLAAAALVFVDVMKELPATMILRPFNFDTLATEAFQLATTERLDQAALPSLAIVAAGLVPVILLTLGMRRGETSR